MKLILIAALGAGSLCLAQNPGWDTTGNGLLNGSYNFRQIHIETVASPSVLSRRIAIWGQINFDGGGKYTLSNAKVLDSTLSGTAQPLALSGTYAISSSGFGFLDNPTLSGGLTFGLVSQGMFIGSSPENEI